MNTSGQRAMVGAQCPLCSADIYVYPGSAPREHTLPTMPTGAAMVAWVACPQASDEMVLDSYGRMVERGGMVRIDLDEMEA